MKPAFLKSQIETRGAAPQTLRPDGLRALDYAAAKEGFSRMR